jgi:hypothetical protein
MMTSPILIAEEPMAPVEQAGRPVALVVADDFDGGPYSKLLVGEGTGADEHP